MIINCSSTFCESAVKGNSLVRTKVTMSYQICIEFRKSQLKYHLLNCISMLCSYIKSERSPVALTVYPEVFNLFSTTMPAMIGLIGRNFREDNFSGQAPLNDRAHYESTL